MNRQPAAKRKIDLRPYAGHLLIAFSPLHFVVGLLVYSDPIADIIDAGVFDAVGDHTDRDAALWFMVTGAFFLLLGIVVWWAQLKTGTLPAALGWGFLILAIAGTIIVPLSGFPLMLPLGILLIAASRQRERD